MNSLMIRLLPVMTAIIHGFPAFLALSISIPNLGHILAMLVDVLLMLNQLVLELLLQVDALVAGLRQAVNGVHHEVEAVPSRSVRSCRRRRDGALFFVATNMDVFVLVRR